MNQRERPSKQGTEVLATLGRQGPAMFVSDLSTVLPELRGQLETLLAELESRGAVLVRDHYCPDPHLEGEDLRIVGLVSAPEGVDGVARCVEMLEATWASWLASYLADHRCS
ncbi:MAG TPA: hypothetical protein VJB57_02540 [Dehalococcoidia bacterium]|nr:hypothetical protein [Dehalococcoidia bacterium]